MTVTHEFEFTAKCPVNTGTDIYECQVTTDRLIPVEDILQITDSYADKTMWHETLCQELASKLGCEVTIRGTHSGVKTTVTCTPEIEP